MGRKRFKEPRITETDTKNKIKQQRCEPSALLYTVSLNRSHTNQQIGVQQKG